MPSLLRQSSGRVRKIFEESKKKRKIHSDYVVIVYNSFCICVCVCVCVCVWGGWVYLCWLYFAGHCWRSRDELISDVLLWTPTHGRAKAGRPARTYIQQLCEATGCCPEDLPRAMNDREEWRERVRDIRATSATWWWWWWYLSYSLRTFSP